MKRLLMNKTNIKLISIFIINCFILLMSSFSYYESTYDTKLYNAMLIDSYNELSDSYNNLLDEYEYLESEYRNLNLEIQEYKDQQATIEDLNAKLIELQSQYDSLQADRDNLQQQVDAKKAVEEQAAREAQQQNLLQQASAGTVYWTPNGECYHSTSSCSTLKRSSNILSGTVTQSGRRPCKVCH